jgi:hypothetical protein
VESHHAVPHNESLLIPGNSSLRLHEVAGTVVMAFVQAPQIIMGNDDATNIVRDSAQEAIAEAAGASLSNVTISSLSSVDGVADDSGNRRLEGTGQYLKVDYQVAASDEANAKVAESKLASTADTSLQSKMNEKMVMKVEALPADNKADLEAEVAGLQIVSVQEVVALAVVGFPDSQSDHADLDAPSCVAEQALRRILKDKSTSPNVIRGIFHDAIDQDNLLVKNHTSGLWVQVNGSYGGVDGCLYSPLTGGTTGTPNPDHNRNIMNGFQWARDTCKTICSNEWPAGLAGTSLCRSTADCEVDITVLGSLLTIENAGGPTMNMSWGRRKSDCSEDNIVTPFTKSVDKLGEYDKNPALNSAPSLTGIDEPDQFRRAFDHFGFSAVDQVALMGAHTFGQLQVCAGGLNGIEHGPFCRDNTKVNIKMGNGSSWYPPSSGFGDGGLWDRTPTRFDNDYFKLFESELFDTKDNCCGKIKNGMCHRGGNMVHITMRNDDLTAAQTEPIEDGQCGVSWCRSDRKGRTHMKSTKAWTTVDASWEGFGKSGKHGVQKRMIRLAGDWALLASPETKSKVQEFANDESAFFAAFSVASGKVISKTHNKLSSCSGHADTASVDRAFEILSCQDTHWKCPNAKCHKNVWAARCPRKCGKCPDQQ